MFNTFPTKPVPHSPLHSPRNIHRSAVIYEANANYLPSRPEAVRTQPERPAPILHLPGLPPRSLPKSVVKPRQKGWTQVPKNWLAQFQFFSLKKSKDVSPPMYTPRSATFVRTPKGLADFDHTLEDDSFHFKSIPPPLYTKHLSEGGVAGWMVVVGAFLLQFGTIGYLSTWNLFEEHYSHVTLIDHNPVVVRWIGSFQLFFVYFLSLPAGKLADAGYFHSIVLSGTLLFSIWYCILVIVICFLFVDKFTVYTCYLLSVTNNTVLLVYTISCFIIVLSGTLLFSICLYLLSFVGDEQYGLVFILQAVGMGTGIGLVFVPSSTAPLHYFNRWKGLVLGIVMSGGALGGMIFPPIIRCLIPQRGLGGATRVTAYIVIGSLLIANCLLTIPDKSDREKYPLPRIDILKYSSETGYVYAAIGICLAMLVISFPQLYLEVLGLERGADIVIAFNSGIVLNLAGGIGGVLLGFLSDKCGIWNIMIPVSGGLALTLFTTCAVQGSKSLIAHAIFYGFFSVSWFSLMVTAIGSLAACTLEMGTRVGLVLTGSSVFSLLSFALQDALLGTNFNWTTPSVLSGFLLLGVTGLVYLSRTKFAAAKHVYQKKYIKGIQIL